MPVYSIRLTEITFFDIEAPRPQAAIKIAKEEFGDSIHQLGHFKDYKYFLNGETRTMTDE